VAAAIAVGCAEHSAQAPHWDYWFIRYWCCCCCCSKSIS